jgi:DNA repair exonuclease SbcCD ATPase subunit
MSRVLRMAVLVGAIALVAGCSSKGPAETALKAADQALEGAKPTLEAYLPAQMASLQQASAAAHEKFDKGDYKGAMADAQALVTQVQAAVTEAGQKKEEYSKMWNEMSGTMPAMMTALETKVNELAAMKKMPAGMNPQTLDEVKTEMAAAQQQWGQASTAYQEGRVSDAMQMAGQVKSSVEGMMAKVGMGQAGMSQAGMGH